MIVSLGGSFLVFIITAVYAFRVHPACAAVILCLYPVVAIYLVRRNRKRPRQDPPFLDAWPVSPLEKRIMKWITVPACLATVALVLIPVLKANGSEVVYMLLGGIVYV